MTDSLFITHQILISINSQTEPNRNEQTLSPLEGYFMSGTHRCQSKYIRVSAHFFPIETGRMMNRLREQRMCPFCLNKQIGDEHHYIFKYTHPKFIPIQTKLYEAISELADRNTYRYESTQDLLLKLLSDKTLSASPRISKLLHTLLETYNNIAKSLVS